VRQGWDSAEEGRRGDLRSSRRCWCHSRSRQFFSSTDTGRGAKRLPPDGAVAASRCDLSSGCTTWFLRLPPLRPCVPGRTRASCSVAARAWFVRRAVSPPLTAMNWLPPEVGWGDCLVQLPAAGMSSATGRRIRSSPRDIARLVAMLCPARRLTSLPPRTVVTSQPVLPNHTVDFEGFVPQEILVIRDQNFTTEDSKVNLLIHVDFG